MSNNQSLNALTVAAAAAAAAACSTNFQETFFMLNDDDKRRILQSFIYKQLNGGGCFTELMCNDDDDDDTIITTDLNGSSQIMSHNNTNDSSTVQHVSSKNNNSDQLSSSTKSRSSFDHTGSKTNMPVIHRNQSDLMQTLFQTFMSSKASSVSSMSESNNNNNNNTITTSTADLVKSQYHGGIIDDPGHRFCSACNIQFMSSKTYKVHKELYCSTRHLTHSQQQQINSSSSSSSSLSSTIITTISPSIVNQLNSNNNNNNNQNNQQQQQQQQQNNMTCGSNTSSKSSSLANSQTSSGIGSSPPPSSFSSSSPNSSSNSISTRKPPHILPNDLQDNNRNESTNDIVMDECNKYTDFRSLFPGLLPGGTSSSSTIVPINGMAQQINESIHNTTPIYIVLSANPLVLIPFSFNNVTNSFEPLPSLAANLDVSIVENLKLLAPSSRSSLMFPVGLDPSSSSSSMQPFITTFDEMRKSVNLKSTNFSSPKKCTATEKSHHHPNINKRSHSESNPDQPLDLSSSGSPVTKRSKSESDNQDSMMIINTDDSPVKKEMENENCEESISSLTNKDQQQQTFQEHMNNLLQKFAMMQSMNSVVGGAPHANANLVPSSASDSSQLASQLFTGGHQSNQLAAALTSCDNPALAQYLAMAMAALTGSNAGSNQNVAKTSIPNPNNNPTIQQSIDFSSPHVDVVVKQGNSRCNECNIVFYKHESYLVHKKLYCASRRNHDSSSINRSISPNDSRNSGVNSIIPTNNRPSSALSNSSSLSYTPSTKFASNLHVPTELIGPSSLKTSSLNPDETLSLSTSPSMLSSREAASVSPAAAAALLSPNKQSAVFQYFCAACGIKYTSYDNLYAHQTYYCLKRNNNGSTAAAAVPASAATAAVINAAPISPATVVSPLPTSPVPSVSVPTPQSLLTPQLLAAAASLGAAATPTTSAAEALLDFTSPTSLSQQWNALVTAAAVVGAKTGASMTNNGLIVGDYNCHKCKASYVSPETLAAHVCSADLRLEQNEKPANTTPSTSSLQTYKCTICGYKGHTMRGMRTHVRVHTEELATTGAFEEDFIVQNTDLPEPSVGRRSSHGNSLTNPSRQRRRSNNIDAQLLSCHSNASLSSNETFDSVIRSTVSNYLESAARRTKEQQHQQQAIGEQQHQPQQKQQQSQLRKTSSVSPLISENSQNQPPSQQSSSQSALQQQQIQNHNCQFCPYTSNYKGNVIRHIKLVHKEINGTSLASSIQQQQHQQQLVKEAIDVLMGVDFIGGGDGDLSSIGTEQTTDMINTIPGKSSKSPTPNKLMNGCIATSSAIDYSSSSSSSSSPPPSSTSTNNNVSMKIDSKQKLNQSSSSTAAKSPLSNAITTTGNTATTTTTLTNNNNNDIDSKYCSACNISFTYRNSYLAHKRYYCSSNHNENT
nr:LOW QUALITY PROTEIN: zinc finger protein ush-like [Dermatophagoides farinae]